jgi:hypothetical protein
MEMSYIRHMVSFGDASKAWISDVELHPLEKLLNWKLNDIDDSKWIYVHSDTDIFSDVFFDVIKMTSAKWLTSIPRYPLVN